MSSQIDLRIRPNGDSFPNIKEFQIESENVVFSEIFAAHPIIQKVRFTNEVKAQYQQNVAHASTYRFNMSRNTENRFTHVFPVINLQHFLAVCSGGPDSLTTFPVFGRGEIFLFHWET